MVTEEQWARFGQDGYLHLGQVLDPLSVEALAARSDQLALAGRSVPGMQFQLDTGGSYEDLPGATDVLGRGTRLYRKIQGLEHDDLFGALLRHPTFVEVCARLYGPHVPISTFRAMVMNKPAGQGTILPWHQDGGAVWRLDRDPLVTIWVALDPATPENGCMDVVPGSHRLGLLSWFGSTVAPEDVARHCGPEAVTALPVEAGHAVLLHNWLLHRSGVNPTAAPRRAFTCCYLDGRTRNDLTGELFPLAWGTLPEGTPPYLEQLRQENGVLRESRASAETYAKSLEVERRRLEALVADSVTRPEPESSVGVSGPVSPARRILSSPATVRVRRTADALAKAGSAAWASRVRRT